MNTLLMDLDGNIYDPTGRGLSDLAHGAILFVGDPAQRIREDYLRILRFFRFHAWYGNGALDPVALSACREYADGLACLSKERVTQEFFKIVSADKAADILEIIFENRILPFVAHKDYVASALESLVAGQNRYGLFSLEARLAVLSCFDPVYVDKLVEHFVFSNAQKRNLEDIIRLVRSKKTPSKVMKYIEKDDVVYQVLLLSGRDEEITDIRDWIPPPLPVNGRDILKAGVPSGPAVGEILAAVESWWIEQSFTPGREECLSFMATLLPGAGT
jgi:poly(A) polymerase